MDVYHQETVHRQVAAGSTQIKKSFHSGYTVVRTERVRSRGYQNLGSILPNGFAERYCPGIIILWFSLWKGK